MANSSERRLAAIEALYSELLLAALRRCAEGQWGLFGQDDALIARLGGVERDRLTDPRVKECWRWDRRSLGCDVASAMERHFHRTHARCGCDPLAAPIYSVN